MDIAKIVRTTRKRVKRMSRYRNIGPEDGWSEPVYADEYGNIVSEEVVLAERRKEQLKREIKRELKEEEHKTIVGVPGSHVYFESEELRKQVEAEVAALPPPPLPEPVDTDLNLSVKKHLEAILDTLGYVMVEKNRWESMNKRYNELERFYNREENRSRGDGHF